MHRRGWFSLVGLALFLAAVPAVRAAVLNSATGAVTLAAPLAESLTVSASAGTVNFILVPSGTAAGAPTFTITTTWGLNASRATLTTYAYFTSSTAALTDGAGDNIPSANVTGSVNGGANTPFSGVSPFAASSSITIFTVGITGANRNGSRADTLALTIDTTALSLPAGNYTGTLTIQAQAI